MVKLNEALIIGGSLLLALVLSKGGGFIKKIPMPQNRPVSVISPIAESVTLPKVQVYQQQKATVNIPSLPTYIESQNVFTQPEKYQKYFSARGGKLAILYKDDQRNIINTYGEVTDENIIKYVDKLLEDPRNRNPLSQKFPVISEGLSNFYNSIIEKQNRAKAQQFADTQQAEISNILNEYETRFGGLSRYG